VASADLLSLDGLLAAFLERVLALVDAERGLLFLERSGQLQCRAALARNGRPLAAAEREVPRQVVEWVLRERRGLVSENVPADARLDYQQSLADLKVKSLLAAPLLDGDEVAGVVYVDRRATPASFTAETRADFDAACADVGVLLAVARRAEDREEESRRWRESAISPGPQGIPGLLGTSSAMRSLFATARIVAASS
jgi:GAF domain-containing protein